MKKVALTLLISTSILCGCFSSSNTTETSKKSEEQESPIATADTDVVSYASLADFLRRNSSVSVTGVDPNIRLQIRGVNSLNADTRPFIYINRNPIGRDYTQANNNLNPNDIKRVEVISSLAQLVRYGQEGHSGVIIVHTKSN